MAVPSVTVTAQKIDVTATGGGQSTLDEICTAIGDTAVMERTGAGPYTYEIKVVSTYRQFEISSGCDVLFEEGDTLNIQGPTSSTYVTLNLVAGSSVTFERDFTLNMNSNSSAGYSYIYLYGALTVQGESGHEVIWKNMRSFYEYSRDAVDVDYLTIRDTNYSSGYMFYFENYTTTDNSATRVYDHVTVTNASGNSGRIYLTYFGNPVINTTLSNWTVSNISNIYFNIATIKITGWNISNTGGVYVYGSGHLVGSRFETSKDDTTFPSGYFQPSLMFEDCTFGSTTGSYCMYAYYGSQIYLKNCTFENETSGIYARYGSRVLEYGDATTFNSITTNRLWSNEGTYLRCRELDITVEDSGGSPVENAMVSIVQLPDYKEKHTGFTDSSGNLLTMYDDLPRAVQREEVSTGSFQNWSNDLSGGTAYHRIVAYKEGVGSAYEDVEVTSDKTITLTLEGLPSMLYDDKGDAYIPISDTIITKV